MEIPSLMYPLVLWDKWFNSGESLSARFRLANQNDLLCCMMCVVPNVLYKTVGNVFFMVCIKERICMVFLRAGGIHMCV